MPLPLICVNLRNLRINPWAKTFQNFSVSAFRGVSVSDYPQMSQMNADEEEE
jgi:hypothetical protein